MKNLLATAMFCAVFLFSAGTSTVQAQSKPKTTTTKKAKVAKVEYTCTMHPEVISNKPGKCPKCGMTLVKKTATKKRPAEIMKM
jgi:hypothetical protein